MRKALGTGFIVVAVIIAHFSLRRVHSAAQGLWTPRVIIMVGIDTLRADRLGTYGYPRGTSPNIDALAAQGVMFERCFSPGNATQFSFPAIFTGMYPPLDHAQRGLRDATCLASLLQSYGWQTGAFTAGGHLNRQFGFDRGFDEYTVPYEFCTLAQTVPLAVNWLEQHVNSGGRCFLFVHGYDCHMPYQKPFYFTKMFNPHPTELGALIVGGQSQVVLNNYTYVGVNGGSFPLTEADCRFVSDAYDGTVSFADLHVGLLMSAVRRLGLTQEALVVVFGDHGEELFERGNLGHGQFWYDEEVHVPLVFWGPGGLPRGLRVPTIVEEFDLFPTLVEFAGIKQNLDVPSVSLRDVVLGQRRLADGGSALSAEGPWGSLRTPRWRFMGPVEEGMAGNRPRELYDLYADPGERVNVVDQPQNASVVRDMQAEVIARYKSHHL